jgi:hypothetical protein
MIQVFLNLFFADDPEPMSRQERSGGENARH